MKASDSSFLEKASQVHWESEAFLSDRLRQLQFTVRHYAGPVSYSAPRTPGEEQGQTALRDTLPTGRQLTVEAVQKSSAYSHCPKLEVCSWTRSL